MQWINLPDQIKGQISEREWLWLSNEEQLRYVNGLVEPEGEEIEEATD